MIVRICCAAIAAAAAGETVPGCRELGKAFRIAASGAIDSGVAVSGAGSIDSFCGHTMSGGRKCFLYQIHITLAALPKFGANTLLSTFILK